LGIGDWGLGIGDWAQSPITNPQSPIPNPQSPIPNPHLISFKKLKFIILMGKFLKPIYRGNNFSKAIGK